MTTDFRVLCIELTDCLEKADWPNRYKQVFQFWVNIARGALAELDEPAVPEGREPVAVIGQPSDGDLDVLMYSIPWKGSPSHWGRQVVRAALTRWGNPAPQPVPVSERLPGPKDCDAEGRCWLRGKVEGDWRLLDPNNSGVPQLKYCFSHWLPAHALPVPGQEVEG